MTSREGGTSGTAGSNDKSESTVRKSGERNNAVNAPTGNNAAVNTTKAQQASPRNDRPKPDGRTQDGQGAPTAVDPAQDVRLLERAIFEVKRVIVGQDRLVERMLVGLLARGHVLLEGVPGVAKTLAVETFAKVVGGTFARIQFTPDLVPTDIVGTRIYRQGREEFDIELGPVVANFVLADEINRAPAKVQSALLEVMAERQVSIGGKTFPMPDPFLVMATQNPIENEGVYPLPEAQRDRFLFKIIVDYPTAGGRARDRLPDGRRPAGAQAGPRPRRPAAPAGASRPTSSCTTRSSTTSCGWSSPPARPAELGLTDVAGLDRLRRLAARHRSASSPRPARWRWCAAATTSSRRTSSTSSPTCCGTAWCCPTTRWPTTISPDRRHQPDPADRRRCRRSHAAPQHAPSGARRHGAGAPCRRTRRRVRRAR